MKDLKPRTPESTMAWRVVVMPSIVWYNAAPESSVHVQLPLHACTASQDLSQEEGHMTCNLAGQTFSNA